MRVGRWSVGVASAALVSLLVASAGAAIILVRSEIRAGGMEDKWVIHDVDSYGNAEMITLLYVDSKGDIIGQEGWNNPPCIVSISPEGAVQWRSPINALPYPVEGLDGRFYYVDWPDPDPHTGGWTNLTSLSAGGTFRWSYVVPNGTLDLWAVYDDGIVIAHHYYYGLNESSQDWEILADRILAISRDGNELWSMNMPIANTSWSNPEISYNGTFVVHTQQSDGAYEFGVGKYGSPTYVQKGNYFVGYLNRERSSYGDVYCVIRLEGVDPQTSVTSMYGFSISSGTQLWRTILGYSDNPDNLTPGGGWQEWLPLADSHGNFFWSDDVSEKTYCMDANGTLVWERPSVGMLIDEFPSGGFLAWDDSSISRINADGSIEWRHYAKLDGYSAPMLGTDETVYYNYGADVHALVPAHGLSANMTFLGIVAVIDVASVIAYVFIRKTKKNSIAGQ